MDRETFLALPTEEIVKIVRRENRPRVGVFVPDGSRRLVLAFTDTEPGTEEFYRLCATLPAQYLLKSLKVFFDHGLPILLVPILSRSVLDRGSNYRRLTAAEGLRLLFTDHTWLSFYDEYDVRVRVYGELERLANTECAEALAWIEETCWRTAAHQTHILFYGIGGSSRLDEDTINLGAEFYQTHGRAPTLKEQRQRYYGINLDSADFFIMTSKLSGMGALPRFLVNGDTEVYFLPTVGAMGLTSQTYRLILYDWLFTRAGLRVGLKGFEATPENRRAWRMCYERMANTVIGLGRQIGGVWTPEI